MTEPGIKLTRDSALADLHQMVRIRRFEEKCAEVYSAGHIRGFLHLYIGQEAIATGVMKVLDPDDVIFATYREHGHALVRGVSARSIMAEMFGKVEGCCRGRGGSMHIFDKEKNFIGGNAIVAGAMPLAVGTALADRMQGLPHISLCFFGEGAMAEGEFHEAVNLAALWQLPVLFICENNLYAMGTALGRSESQTDLTAKVRSYKVPCAIVDGMDVQAVEAATRRAIKDMRELRCPYFMEMRTYRFRAHSMFDPELYRDAAEVDEWRKRDPIELLKGRMTAAGLLREGDLAEIEAKVKAEVDDAVSWALNGTLEDPSDLTKFVYVESAAAGGNRHD